MQREEKISKAIIAGAQDSAQGNQIWALRNLWSSRSAAAAYFALCCRCPRRAPPRVAAAKARPPPPPSAVPLDAAFADHPSAEIRVPSLDVGPLARAYDEIKNLGSKVL
jgi:hypothetical protein